MTKQDFIQSKVAELKKIVYAGELELATEEEDKQLERFCSDFIEDLRKLAENKSK